MVGHRRTRTGCLSCRVRRKKCDGGKPACGNCNRTQIQCKWGIKARFHPSRQLALTTSDQLHLSAIERGRHAPDSSAPMNAPYKIVDKTDDIVRWCQGDRGTSPLPLSDFDSDEDDVSVPRIQTTTDIQSRFPVLVDHDTPSNARGPIFATTENPETRTVLLSLGGDEHCSPALQDNNSASLTSIPITTEGLDWLDSCPLPFSLGLAVSRTTSPAPEVPLPIPEKDVISLLKAYFAETATWCETTDSGRHFSTLCTHEIVENKIFQSSALALARRQLSMVGRGGESIALRLYQHTIQLLIQQDPEEAGAAILAACTLLCVYEMMASDVINWRRHLKGCTAFFLARGWNGSSPGLIKACFWAFARIDIWAAFVLKKPTLIPTDHWVDDESLQSAANHEYPDNYCNLMIHLFAKIINCIASTHSSNYHSRSSCLRDLWDRIQEWWSARPASVLPIYRSREANRSPFPGVYFASPSSICGTSFYHAASMLILKEFPSLTTAEGDVTNPIWHASQICGISVSNQDHANWVNHLQPLFMAGEIFAMQGNIAEERSIQSPFKQRSVYSASSPGSPFVTHMAASDVTSNLNHASDYSAEKIALLQHLIRIQRETGWTTGERAKQLRRLWGLE